jgi:inhibitor of cysteine peptidase
MNEKDFLKNIIASKTGDKEKIRLDVQAKKRAKKGDIIITWLNKPKGGLIMRKSIAIAVICVVLIGAALTAALSVYTPEPKAPGEVKSATYEQIFGVIENFHKLQNRFSADSLLNFGLAGKSADYEAPSAPEAAESRDFANDYSKTNIQTEGVDEGDIVKNDGQYIYKINTSGCIIVSAQNGEMEVVSEIKVNNYIPQELYVIGDKLIMIGGIYEYFSYYNGSPEPLMDCFYWVPCSQTDIRIYDIADRSEPELLRQLTMDGNYNTSRILLEDNKLFYMVNYYFNYGNEDKYIPELSDSEINGGERGKIPAENIYYYDDVINYSYLIIGNIDLDDPSQGEQGAFLGLSGTIYVSAANIYVASYDYYSTIKTNIFGWIKEDKFAAPTSRIVKIALSDLQQKASARVYGSLKDRYSMDEYDGYLRLATTVRAGNVYNMVYVLKPDLTVAGKIDNIAEGESIYSVRFKGTKGSLVTFRQIDPYFNLDLSDPFDPKISKGLKEEGVSYYIHYLGDTDYTIGVGVDMETTVTQWGEQTRSVGLKVSLYDNSSGEAVNIKTWTLEGSCYSELFYNPKALLYDESRGLFAFSYENWIYSSNYYYYSLQQGLAVFRFDLDGETPEEKLSYSGTLTNLSTQPSNYNGYDWYEQYRCFITRGVRIGDYIYTISDKYIVSYNLDTLEEQDRIVNDTHIANDFK